MSDRVARAFNSSEAAPAVVLDISKAFYRFGMLVFFPNLGFVEFRVRYLILFHLFSVTVGFEWFWMGNLPKSIHLMLEFFKTPLWSYTFSTNINYIPDVICNIVTYADVTALYSKCDQASDQW